MNGGEGRRMMDGWKVNEWMGKWKERMSRRGWGIRGKGGGWLLGWLHELGDRMEEIFFSYFLSQTKTEQQSP